MKPTTVHIVCFSPTGTTRKIATAIAQGLSAEAPQIVDLTLANTQPTHYSSDDCVVFAVPVYGGHVPPVALARMGQLAGDKTPAVITVIYGNRAFEAAAVELGAFVAARGFVPVAAGAFVGEHSYSTPTTPIAAGRPDAIDLADAGKFGKDIALKLSSKGVSAVDLRKLRTPRTPLWSLLRFIRFVLAYRRAQKRHPIVYLPVCDEKLCTHCGLCATHCPVQAITKGSEQLTDPAKCLRCCACVKICPKKARTFHTPFSTALSHHFAQPKPPTTLW